MSSSYGYGQNCRGCFPGCVGNCCQSRCCQTSRQPSNYYQPVAYCPPPPCPPPCPPPPQQPCFIPGPPGCPGEPGCCINQVHTVDIQRSRFTGSGEYKGYTVLFAPLDDNEFCELRNNDYKVLNVSILGNTLPGGIVGQFVDVAISAGTTFNYFIDRTNRRIGLTFFVVAAAEYLRVIEGTQPTTSSGSVWNFSDQVSRVRILYVA